MAKVLLPPLILLLVLFIAFTPRGVLSQDGDQDCHAADVVLGEGQRQVKAAKTTKHFIVDLYVMPLRGFEEVRLDVDVQDGTRYTAWFPLKPECLSSNDTWYQVRSWTRIFNKGTRIHFGFKFPGCWRKCIITNTVVHDPYNITMVAYGPSRWRKKEPPRHCNIITTDTLPPIQTNPPTCSNPPTTATATTTTPTTLTPTTTTTTTPTTLTPTTTTTTTPTTTITIITVAFLVVVVMLIVVIVCWKRNTRTSHEAKIPSQPAHPAPQPAHPAPRPAHPAPWPAHPVPQPAHPAPWPAHPAPRPQFNSGRERAVQDTDSHIYDVLKLYEVPRLHDTESRTNDHVPVYHNVADPAQPHPESPIYQNVSLYDDVAAPAQPRPESPIYQNVSLYDDVAAPAQPRPESPTYQNVSLYDDVVDPAGRPQDPQGRESELYLTVL